MTRIAIIGAGLSGLVAARALSADHSVSVFEKARAAGGRMSTRYVDDWFFDHGAQFFTARMPAFREFLEPIIDAGVVKLWSARFVEIDRSGIIARRHWNKEYPHFVASPNMNALGRHLAAGLNVILKTRVARLEKLRNRWQLYDADANFLGAFDWVVVTAPAPQAASLLPEESRLSRHAKATTMLPCFALMLGFDRAPPTDWDTALVKDFPISWISVNSSKPDRVGKASWVVHVSNAWAAQHLEDEPNAIKARLLGAVSDACGLDLESVTHCGLHRWRFANAERQERVPQVDTTNRLAACGDWYVRGRVEGAFTSAQRMVEQLRQAI